MAETADKLPDPKWLPKMHVAILLVVDQLQGQGRPVTITLKVEELSDERMVPGSDVLLILLMMERAGLVSSSPIDPEQPDAPDGRYFELTSAGGELLAKAFALRGGVTEPLEGFA